MSRAAAGIITDEHGDETHESWILVRAAKVSTTGARLFDSEIRHSRYVEVTVSRCTRQRQLNRDYLHDSQTLIKLAMSEAQWGAFVSSFGVGVGVPATLTWLSGAVPGPPAESRLDESHREVRDAGEKALASIIDSYDSLAAAFEEGAGKRIMRERIRDLGIRLQSGPKNMKFAAESLTEHVENVVTKARADIERMTTGSQGRLDAATRPLLGPADHHDDGAS